MAVIYRASEHPGGIATQFAELVGAS